MSDNEFEQGDAGSSITELAEAGRMKPGSLIMLKSEFPCKVVSFSTAKPGKHGSAKAMITGKDIFTDRQYEETFGTGDMIPRPVVKKLELNCICVDGEFLQCLLPNGEMKEDCKLPTEAHLEDVRKRIEAILEAGTKECLVTIQQWGERQQVILCREGNDQWISTRHRETQVGLLVQTDSCSLYDCSHNPNANIQELDCYLND